MYRFQWTMKRVYSNENGGLLVILLILFVLLMGIIIVLATFLWAQNQALQSSEATVKAFYCAQSGLEKCLSRKNISDIDTTAIGQGKFVVKVQAFRKAKKYRIQSTGIFGRKMRTLSVLVKKLKNSKFKILDWQDSYLNRVTE